MHIYMYVYISSGVAILERTKGVPRNVCRVHAVTRRRLAPEKQELHYFGSSRMWCLRMWCLIMIDLAVSYT